MNRINRILYLALIYAFLYIPIAIVIWLSFNDARYSLLWHGFTWKWYVTLAHDADIIQVAINSLILGIFAASLATVLGAFAAINLYRYRFFGHKGIYNLLFMMIIMPDIVIAIALLLLFKTLHLKLGFWTLLLAHTTFCLPFVFITTSSRLSGMNKHIIEAARDLGATEQVIFFRVLLPLLLPALISGWLLSFTLSLDDVIISYFVTGPGFEILPLKIYSMVRLGVNPEINALSTILFTLTLFVVFTSQLLTRKKP